MCELGTRGSFIPLGEHWGRGAGRARVTKTGNEFRAGTWGILGKYEDVWRDGGMEGNYLNGATVTEIHPSLERETRKRIDGGETP